MHSTDCSNLSNEINDVVVLPDHEDEPVPILRSAPDAQNVNSDSVVSLPVSGETRVNSGNTSNSPSYCDNKSAYTSMVGCPSCLLFLFQMYVSIVEEIVVNFC